jgi:hypothetical protein
MDKAYQAELSSVLAALKPLMNSLAENGAAKT